MTDAIDHDRRMTAALAELESAGVSANAAKPLLFRLLAGLGLKVRPPLYQGHFANFAQNGLFFGVTWGGLMYYFSWSASQMPIAGGVVAMVCAGVLFGAGMAAFTAYQRRSKKLSRWEEL
jgi:hypothetical protein